MGVSVDDGSAAHGIVHDNDAAPTRELERPLKIFCRALFVVFRLASLRWGPDRSIGARVYLLVGLRLVADRFSREVGDCWPSSSGT
jgi:hypothetical protein